MSNAHPNEPRRKHRLTRLGFHFLFVGSFAMLGGALRGFNLLLVLAGLLVGALIMQWRWSRRSVEAISVKRRMPSEAFAGKPFRVRYRLRNYSQFMPVWMIRIEDRIESVDGNDQALAVCGVGVISAKQTVVPHYDCLITRRGRYNLGPIGLMTTFPFALFSSRQITDHRDELHVFPELLLLRSRWRQHLTSRSGGESTTARRSGPVEGDFFGLREWQTGDSPKWIHWRTTARLGEPAVRQFEQQRRFDTCVLIDAHQNEDQDNTHVETAISLTATFLVHLVGSPSNRVVLSVAGSDTKAVIGGGSTEGKRRMLEVLADIVSTDQTDLTKAVSEAIHVVGHTQDMIVVSTRSLEEAKQADSGLARTLAPWIRRGTFRWINVSGRELDRWIVRSNRGNNGTDPAASTTAEKKTSASSALTPAEAS
ncbi:MAG: DUF58 domain-containing protein [Rubripirellula sp.]